MRKITTDCLHQTDLKSLNSDQRLKFLIPVFTKIGSDLLTSQHHLGIVNMNEEKRVKLFEISNSLRYGCTMTKIISHKAAKQLSLI